MSERGLPAPVLEWVRGTLGSRVPVVDTRLFNVGSTTLHTVDAIGMDGVVRHMLARRFHDRARLGRDRWYDPANEARVLALLERSEVPAPRLIAADLDASTCDVPTLLIQRLPGRVPAQRPSELDPFVSELARVLVAIHAVGGAREWLEYEPYHLDPPSPPAWSERAELWERVFGLLAGPPPAGPIGFIHRDFHHGQTLWRSGRILGVVDWVTGCLGPRAVDLARAQLNLAADYGVDAARRFVAIHEQLAGESLRHPYWDLRDAADALPDMPAPRDAPGAARYRRFEEWAALAAAELG